DVTERAECTLPGVNQTYRAIRVDNSNNLSYELVSDCAQLVIDLGAAEADVAVAQQQLNDAMMLDPSSPQIEELEFNLAVAEDRESNVEFDLRAVEQQMQYTRLVHLIYEHGVEL
ncbi:MAG: hypothetical protein AAF658_22615, partial [Myxococcota bacterium]